MQTKLLGGGKETISFELLLKLIENQFFRKQF